jgi:hypothetical protein
MAKYQYQVFAGVSAVIRASHVSADPTPFFLKSRFHHQRGERHGRDLAARIYQHSVHHNVSNDVRIMFRNQREERGSSGTAIVPAVH